MRFKMLEFLQYDVFFSGLLRLPSRLRQRWRRAFWGLRVPSTQHVEGNISHAEVSREEGNESIWGGVGKPRVVEGEKRP